MPTYMVIKLGETKKGKPMAKLLCGDKVLTHYGKDLSELMGKETTLPDAEHLEGLVLYTDPEKNKKGKK